MSIITCLEACLFHPPHFSSVDHVSVEWSQQCQVRVDGGGGGWLWWRRV